jgi:hypothetical protein
MMMVMRPETAVAISIYDSSDTCISSPKLPNNILTFANIVSSISFLMIMMIMMMMMMMIMMIIIIIIMMMVMMIPSDPNSHPFKDHGWGVRHSPYQLIGLKLVF